MTSPIVVSPQEYQVLIKEFGEDAAKRWFAVSKPLPIKKKR
jgi:hypothetical protein